MKSRRRFLLLLLIGALLLAPFGDAGQADDKPRQITLTYYGYLGALKVAELDLTVELAEATPPFGAYRMVADIRLAGLYAKMIPFAFRASADSAAGAAAPGPRRYLSQLRLIRQQETILLSYDAAGQVTIDSDPPSLESVAASTSGIGHRTLDPLSATLGVVARVAARGNCDGSVAVFDGVRRYDLDLATVGQEEIDRFRFSDYVGPALHCWANARLIAGFPADAAQSGYYPRRTDMWFAPLLADAPALPVRFLAEAKIGVMRVDLVGLTVAP